MYSMSAQKVIRIHMGHMTSLLSIAGRMVGSVSCALRQFKGLFGNRLVCMQCDLYTCKIVLWMVQSVDA